MSLTSQIRYVRALDTTSLVGAGKTGLVFGDVTAKYLVEGGTLTALTTETITTLGTYQAPTSAAHVRIKELSNADPCKGMYEVHFHNTQVAAAGKRLWLFLSASGALFDVLTVDLLANTVADGAISDASFTVPAMEALATALLDLANCVGTETLRQLLKINRAANAGISDGFPARPGTVHYRDAADTKNVITAELDGLGNRLNVTVDVT